MPLPTVHVQAVPEFWKLPTATLLEHLNSSPDGLSNAEASARLAHYGPNLIHGERKQALDDPVFRRKVDDLVETKRHEAEAPNWFQQQYPQNTMTSVAYFSMEFMLSEALPIYSGGLGNVAGDPKRARTWSS